MFKKIFAAAVALCVFLTVLCVPVCAAGQWDGYIPVSNATQLDAIRNSLSGKYYLTADITLNGEITKPIGEKLVTAFTGVFDGNGHTISGLSISSTQSYVGLFGYSKGTIKNVTLKNALVSSTAGNNVSVGLLAGCSSGTITNCKVYGTVQSENSTLNAKVGLLAGNAPAGSITRCVASGTVTVNGFNAAAGVLCGELAADVDQCATLGNVTVSVTGEARAGGIAGNMSAKISNSQNSASVTLTAQQDGYVGGIAGEGSARITNVLNTGSISIAASSHTYAGGICGKISADRLSNAYHTTTYSDATYVSETALNKKSTFTGFDFDTIWVMGNQLPQLQILPVSEPIPIVSQPDNTSSASSTGSQTGTNTSSSTDASTSTGNTSTGGSEGGSSESSQTSVPDLIPATGAEDLTEDLDNPTSSQSSIPVDNAGEKPAGHIWIWIVAAIVVACAAVVAFMYFKKRRLRSEN